MTIHWNQHAGSMRIEQPKLADFADWISTYAEACGMSFRKDHKKQTGLKGFPKLRNLPTKFFKPAQTVNYALGITTLVAAKNT